MRSCSESGMIDDLWYKNAVIYCLDVEKYVDGNGDGVGDFAGLTRRLDYLAGLGVTCLWLQPFYPSPNRDNGYDVTDYYGVHPKLRHVRRLRRVHEPRRSSSGCASSSISSSITRRIEHPWFQAARKSPQSPYRDWYVWSKKRPKDYNKGMVFPGVQKTTWTRDRESQGEYYFHRFYDFQPDLNTEHPAVRAEILRIMGFWLQLGVSRLPHGRGAVPDRAQGRPRVGHAKDYELLHEMRDFLQWRRRDAILLAEANVPPDESLEYFGDARRPPADDAELPGQPAPVLRAGDRATRAARPARSKRRKRGRRPRSGCISCAATTSSISDA